MCDTYFTFCLPQNIKMGGRGARKDYREQGGTPEMCHFGYDWCVC